MAAIVKLEAVIEAMELPEEWQALLNPETGEIVTITDEESDYVEDAELDLDDLPEWERAAVAEARRVLESDRWLPLPDKFDIHEWGIMRDFSNSMEEPQRRELFNAIHGTGAFRMFRATTEWLGLRETWYAYRDEAIRQIAKDWLEANGIAYTEERQPPGPGD